MKTLFVTSFALAISAVVATQPAMASDQPKHHSLEEYAYLIGKWKCTESFPGKPDASYETSMRWMYPEHTVIDQSIETATVKANFILTYDKNSDAFKGIYVMNDGSVGVWENPGPVAGGWTEIGYDFKGDKLIPITRATFTGVTSAHDAFRY